jgi:CheY-like chemotaxis protein
MPIRVLAVDDSDVFLGALGEVLDACPDFALVGAARTGEAAIEVAPGLRPDLVLIDLILPGMDGVETARRLSDLRLGAHLVLCSVGEDTRRPGEQTDVPFVAKADISPGMLRVAWNGRPHRAGARVVTTAAATPPRG